MKRGGILLVAVATMLSLAIPAAADRPSSYVDEGMYMGCGFEFDGLFADAWLDMWGAGMTVWAPDEEEPRYEGWTESATFGDGTFVATLPLMEWATGEYVADVTVTGTYQPTGEVDEYADRFRDGNRWVEIHETHQFLVGAATAEFAFFGEEPFTVEAFDCWGDMYRYEEWSTNPRSYVNRYEGTDLFCEWEADGWFVSLQGYDFDDYAELFVIGWGPGEFPWEGEPAFVGWQEGADLSQGAWHATIPVSDTWDGEPLGDAVIDGTLMYGEITRTKTFWQDSVAKTTSQAITASGTLSLPFDLSFDLSACEGSSWSEWYHVTQPNGPKADVGKAPVHDAPDGALELVRKANTSTRNAAFEPEVGCEMVDPWDGWIYQLPIYKTVWYTVDGTGLPMTVDSAGSDFDTVMGVYVMVDGVMANIACVDDVFETGFSFQAAATFDTEPGTTYYIQVGGYGGQYGHLKLAVR